VSDVARACALMCANVPPVAIPPRLIEAISPRRESGQSAPKVGRHLRSGQPMLAANVAEETRAQAYHCPRSGKGPASFFTSEPDPIFLNAKSRLMAGFCLFFSFYLHSKTVHTSGHRRKLGCALFG